MRRREDLISEYLLAPPQGPERERIEELLSASEQLREQARRAEPLRQALEHLPEQAWSLVELPAAREHRSRRRPAPALAVGLATVLIAIGIAIGAALDHGGSTPGGPSVVLRPIAGTGAQRALARMMPGGRMLLTVQRLPALDSRHYYEVWLMNSTSSLVAVASFRVGANGHARVETALPVSPSGYRYLDISVQAADAGPAHSEQSVLRAALSS